MKKHIKLWQSLLISLISVIFVAATSYIPMVSVLIPVPFVILLVLSKKLDTIISVIVSVIAIFIITDPTYTIDICLNLVIPGIIIGIITKKVLDKKEPNKYQPIYTGSIVFILAVIVNFIISKYIYKVNLLDEFTSMLNDGVLNQLNDSTSTLMQQNGITQKTLVDTVINLVPALLFFRGIVLSILTYFVGIYSLKKIDKFNLKEIKFSKFYLPGNAIMTSFIMYLAIMLLSMMNTPLYTDIILVNLQIIFNVMFIIQGVSVSVFFVKKWFKQGLNGKSIITIVIVCLFGIMGISMVGMVDSILDFRKVRRVESA